MDLKNIKDNLTIELNKNKKECYSFVENNHYTKSYGAGSKYCFSLIYNNEIVGVGLWRTPNGRLTFKLFPNLSNNKRILDLTRLVLKENMPKNSESYFLSRMIKYIKINDMDIDYLITYADYNQGHCGIIYKASNWIPFGVGGDSRKSYHIKDNGKLELTSSRWLCKYDKDKIKIIKIKPKFRYFYPLRIKRKKIVGLMDINKYILEHKKLEEEYLNCNDFIYKEIVGQDKYVCLKCKEFIKLCKCNNN
jgi:hypothetical protein